jgi:hypothetical protein
MQAACAPLAELGGWQAILDRHAELFASLVPDAALGIVPRYIVGPEGARRAAAMPETPPVDMLVLERRASGMCARTGVYRGLKQAGVDVLFFAEAAALEAVLARAPDNPFGEMKRCIRGGRIQLMVMHERRRLRELGYEDFMESLGLPFLGACR